MLAKHGKKPGKTGTAAQKRLPPFAALAGRLRERIDGKRFRAGSLLGTEVSLAKESGLSRMTVRRAVEVLIDEGLLVRHAGRGIFLAGGVAKKTSVRFLAGNLLWMPAVTAAHAVQEFADKRGVEVSVFDARGDIGAFRRELAALDRCGADGAIVMSQHDAECNRILGIISLGGFPLTVIDQAFSEIPVASVASDNREGGRLAGETLISAGHGRIAFLGDMSADTTAARAQGVADACAAALVPPPEVFDIPGQRFGDWEPAIREKIAEILSRETPPTALACSCDAVARHAMRALAKAGVEVPRDMSVTGFDDDPIAEWTSPPLTTVRQDFSAMGRRALEILLRRVETPAAPAASECVPVSVVSRGSVARPAQATRPGKDSRSEWGDLTT